LICEIRGRIERGRVFPFRRFQQPVFFGEEELSVLVK